ncbi:MULTISPECIES: acyl-CoA dehydrogenase family protein [Nocardia]|uniref:acyl-CoA dehydrogenase family protein n=1 Tax=Nocardia abscessus TaxID=120957 RepID=UPI00189321A8|nr:acyl-CoA dehydrogenase family protein [Nocardia abscessus]MBF6472514.1 acyl-CoA/acyl-ACP dehydrogenase [Nocardia abscessus]
MDMLFTAEQEAIAASLAKYLTNILPRAALHTADRPGQVLESLATEQYWTGLAEMGLFMLGVGEEFGGAGLGAADEVAAFRELGRHLAVGPVVGTVLAAQFAAGVGDTALTEALMSGRTRAAVAFRQPGAEPEIGSRVTGSFRVYALETADHILVLDGETAALVPGAGLTVDAVDAVDPTAPVSIAEIDSPANLLDFHSGLMRRGTILQAALFCGMAEAALANSVEYVKQREQFGKPIGAFQAVKHRCAEMAVRAETAFFQTVYAALTEDEGHAEPDFHAASALIVARDAARLNAADNIQNHGGMGFTAEADPHLFARRQIAQNIAFGSRRHQLEIVARADNPL